MILNVIDFNDYLKKSYRNRFCVYRNLEIGHEIHVYNENSALMKACQKTIEPDIKKILSKIHFSPTYEYYKLFLMYHLGGWFIEEDEIFYDQNINPKKTVPTCATTYNASNISFCTWRPVFIKLDSSTKFFLKKSLETLKVYLREGFFDNTFISHPEVAYQIIYSDYDQSEEFLKNKSTFCKVLNFCEYFDCDVIHCAVFAFDEFDRYFNKDSKHYDDLLLAKTYHEMDRGNTHGEKIITYEDLLKFDTFKIMP